MLKEEAKTIRMKPFCLNYSESKKELFDKINELSKSKGIPMYMMETILKEALYQVHELANAEIEQAREKFEFESANEFRGENNAK